MVHGEKSNLDGNQLLHTFKTLHLHNLHRLPFFIVTVIVIVIPFFGDDKFKVALEPYFIIIVQSP